MKSIGVISMKGGVGKTTITANLASDLARLQPGPVGVIDLDPQNGLAWHFTGDAAGLAGVCEAAVARGSLGQGWDTESGVVLFPYGRADEGERLRFEGMLESSPHWLAQQLRALEPRFRGGVVVVDTPPGHGVYLQQALAACDQLLMVALPDMASLATIADMESVLEPVMAHRPHVVTHYLFNQVEPGQPIDNEVITLMANRFGPRVIPLRIHRDESVAEALACHTSVNAYDPGSQGRHDMQSLAQHMLELLPG